MKVSRIINNQVEVMDINAEHLKQFKKAGWIEYNEPKQTIEQVTNTLTDPIVPEDEPVKNKGGRPKKVINN